MKKSNWKVWNYCINLKSTVKGLTIEMPLSYKLKSEDEGRRFNVYIGNRKNFLNVSSDMVGLRLGQFFLTKKLGNIIHLKKIKGKKRK